MVEFIGRPSQERMNVFAGRNIIDISSLTRDEIETIMQTAAYYDRSLTEKVRLYDMDGKIITASKGLFFPTSKEKMMETVAHLSFLDELTYHPKAVKYCKLFGSDALRYFVLRELTFGSDGNFSLSGFIARYNSVLANSYGNLCSRVLSFINKYCNSVLETPQNLENEYIEFSNNIDSYLNECIQLIEQYSFSKYLEKIEVPPRNVFHIESITTFYPDGRSRCAIWNDGEDESAAEAGGGSAGHCGWAGG